MENYSMAEVRKNEQLGKIRQVDEVSCPKRCDFMAFLNLFNSTIPLTSDGRLKQ